VITYTPVPSEATKHFGVRLRESLIERLEDVVYKAKKEKRGATTFQEIAAEAFEQWLDRNAAP
jgi:hypothetical protein